MQLVLVFLNLSRVSEVTLGPLLRFLCYVLGTKLGGVLLFRVSFEKDVWLLVSRLGGWLMARQEQQQRRNSKSSSSSSRLQPAASSNHQSAAS